MTKQAIGLAMVAACSGHSANQLLPDRAGPVARTCSIPQRATTAPADAKRATWHVDFSDRGQKALGTVSVDWLYSIRGNATAGHEVCVEAKNVPSDVAVGLNVVSIAAPEKIGDPPTFVIELRVTLIGPAAHRGENHPTAYGDWRLRVFPDQTVVERYANFDMQFGPDWDHVKLAIHESPVF